MTDEPHESAEPLIPTDGSSIKGRDTTLADFEAFIDDQTAEGVRFVEAMALSRRQHKALLTAGWRDDPELPLGDLWDLVPASQKKEAP